MHKETEWHNVLAWNKLAEACNQHLKKGSLIYLEGRLHTPVLGKTSRRSHIGGQR
jgi:single-strand DNA-binding protein